MKNLKYIKLFEAFESDKLSKTLAYIKEKESFLSKVKKICDGFDFPYSKLNDDLFDYLPFSKALKKADAIDDEPCKATSIGEFDDGGIDGEKCESGKIKRKWGARERIVSCPNCNGTGIEPKKPGLVKLVKFWFTKEGGLVGITAVDGLARNISEQMSYDINDYTIGDNVAKSKLKSLPTGTYLKLDYDGWRTTERDLVCYIINDNRTIYGIQNRVNGSSPWRYSNWNKIGAYSTELDSRSVSNIKILIPNKINTDPYSINAGTDISYSGISINNRIDVKDLIKNAHFALIMDLGKLKETDYKKVRVIKSERDERKSGSKLELTDDEVKSQNIKRYLDKISKSIDITDDVKNISKFVKRLLGFRSALYTLLFDSNVKDSLSNVINYYYGLISNPSEESVENVKYYTKRSLSRSSDNLLMINNNLKEIKVKLKGYTKETELLKNIDELSLLIYDKISNLELETIEDLEVAHQKLLSIRNIFTTSRYKISNINQFINYLSYSESNRSFRELTDSYRIQDNIDDILSEVDRVKKIIEKI